MPRSAEAATHFTPTTPHAVGKSSPSTSTAPPSASGLSARTTAQRSQPTPPPPRKPASPGVPGETPQQKVARLRAAAAKSRNAQASGFDRLIVTGRVWADRAHRFTALSLIGITGIAGAVTVYALGDMIIYNRRKRAEYFTEQKALHASSVFEAQKAQRNGVATERQLEILESEANAEKFEARKREQKGMFGRGKDWLFSGLKKDESEAGTSSLNTVSDNEAGLGSSKEGTVDEVMRAIEEKKAVVVGRAQQSKDNVADRAHEAFEKERLSQRSGGPLDRIGTPAASPTDSMEGEVRRSGGGGWTSFMTRN